MVGNSNWSEIAVGINSLKATEGNAIYLQQFLGALSVRERGVVRAVKLWLSKRCRKYSSMPGIHSVSRTRTTFSAGELRK
jgi:hypothetical protein